MLTVRFEDHSAALYDRLFIKLKAAVGAAAQVLATEYREGLQKTLAPPHSGVYEIPHAYLGWKPGGYGPTNPPSIINNIPPEFASAQSDYLSSYIEGEAVGDFFDIAGVVGFAPSHVATRDQNYLIGHDQKKRPWVRPIFEQSKQNMAAAAKSAFEGAG